MHKINQGIQSVAGNSMGYNCNICHKILAAVNFSIEIRVISQYNTLMVYIGE